MSNTYKSIYDMVCQIPEGCVATYGQIARNIGKPQPVRQIGYALSVLGDKHDVPWHRVVNAKGQISQSKIPGYDDYQRILLEDEGIKFNEEGRISLLVYQWRQC